MKSIWLVAGALVAGFFLGCAWSSRVFLAGIAQDQPALAGQAAWDTVILATLRLNEPADATRMLQSRLDGEMAALADDDSLLSAGQRRNRNRFLTSAKVYYTAFQPTGEAAGAIRSLLAQIPDRPVACPTGPLKELDERNRAPKPSSP